MKLIAVLGTVSAYNTITKRPIGFPPIEMSKNTYDTQTHMKDENIHYYITIIIDYH